LCDNSFARDDIHSATDAIPNATTYTAANSTRNTFGASRSVQLRCRCGGHLGSGQESVVLPYPSPWMPTDRSAASHAAAHPPTGAADTAAAACRSLQLQ